MSTRIPYQRDPDFSRPLLQIPEAALKRMAGRMEYLYGSEEAARTLPELKRILKVHHAHKPPELVADETQLDPEERFTERDLVLITYGDSIKGERGETIKAMHEFVQSCNLASVNTIHMLPFFPYSSDRGFAVVDFSAVDPKMGTWDAVRALGADYDLMFDAVFNHASSRSELFRGFLRGDPAYKDFFTAYESPDDLTPDQRSKIFRPRTSDILTRFETIEGPRFIWTTFSPDQIDFNFRNPQVLLSVLEALLFYVRRGADIIRLDAVTYLWSEPGTESIHLPQTHVIIKLLRDVLDTVAPGVALITETNVPHEQNISYFGDGSDEAHMIYNFALPPLVLHTMYSGDTGAISEWAAGLELPSDQATFFNILDTHDGVGVQGVKGILSPEQIEAMIETARQHGAYISYKATATGEEPYEINTTWWSAINIEGDGEDIARKVRRYTASRSMAFALKGVPGIYTHGAIALPNDYELAERSGVKRDVNRGLIDPDMYREQIGLPDSKRGLLRAYQSKATDIRAHERAFHPRGEQRVLTPSGAVFAVLRISPEGDRRVLALTNVTDAPVRVELPLGELGGGEAAWRCLLTDQVVEATDGRLAVELDAYDVIWLQPQGEGLATRTD